MKHTKIYGIVSVFDNLAPDLLEQVEKASHATGEKEDETIGVKDAERLASFDDHQEQRDLAKALLKSREQHGNLKQKNITEYKKAPEEIKQKVRQGIIDIADTKDEITIFNNEQLMPKVNTFFTPTFEEQMNDFDSYILKAEVKTKMLDRIFTDIKFNEKYDALPSEKQELLYETIIGFATRLKQCSEDLDVLTSQLNRKNLLEVKQ